MLINRKSLQNIVLHTLPGLFLGLVLFLFPFPGLPVLLLPIGLPVVFFLRALRQEINISKTTPKVKNQKKTTVLPIPKKILLPVQLLRSDELIQFEQLLQQNNDPLNESFKIKLQKYKDFLEKKELLTQQTLLCLKNPVTIEGVSKNIRWTQVMESKSLHQCLYSKETLNDKELSLRNFLVNRTTTVTHYYDGYPTWLYYFSMFVRKMLTKTKDTECDFSEKKDENFLLHANDVSINTLESVNTRENSYCRP